MKKSSSEFRNYFNRLDIDPNQCFKDELDVRNHFNIPLDHKCVDGIAHEYGCTYYLLEEKSASKIKEALIKFEKTVEILENNGFHVSKCVLFYSTLRKFKSSFKVMNGKLYSKLDQHPILINNTFHVEAIQIK